MVHPTAESGAAVSPASAADAHTDAFLAALGRALVVAGLYPMENQRFQEVAQAVREGLGRIAGRGVNLLVRLVEDGFEVHGRRVRPEDRSGQNLHRTLDALGIEGLEFDLSLTAADLHALASALRDGQRQQAAHSSFQRVEYQGLPSTVRVTAREFGRVVKESSGKVFRAEKVQKAIDRTLEALDGMQVDEATRERCERLLDKVYSALVERVELPRAGEAHTPSPNGRGLDEMLGMGVDAMRSSLREGIGRSGRLDRLSRVFEAVEKALALSEDTVSARLMTDVLTQAAREVEDEEAVGEETSPDPAAAHAPEPAAADIERLLAEYAPEIPPLGDVMPRDESEQLSIVLQMLLRAGTAEERRVAGLRLEPILRRSLGPDEQAVLSSALVDLLSTCEHPRIDACLSWIGPPLRLSRADRFALFLCERCRGAPPQVVEGAWPHVARELLRGFELPVIALERELCAIVSGLPASLLACAVQRLVELDGFEEDALSPALFAPPHPGLRDLFAALLAGRRGARVGEAVLAGFRAHPPAWIGAAPLRAFGSYEPALRPLLERWLREERDGKAGPELRRMAGALVSRRLRILDRTERAEVWVAEAVGALGRLGGKAAEELLHEVLSARRGLVFHAWPRACRKAARGALGMLRGGAAGVARG